MRKFTSDEVVYTKGKVVEEIVYQEITYKCPICNKTYKKEIEKGATGFIVQCTNYMCPTEPTIKVTIRKDEEYGKYDNTTKKFKI